MVSKRDFDNVTYGWSCNIYALKRDLGLNYQHLSLLCCLLPSSTYVYQHFKAKSDFGRENVLDIQVNVCYMFQNT